MVDYPSSLCSPPPINLNDEYIIDQEKFSSLTLCFSLPSSLSNGKAQHWVSPIHRRFTPGLCPRRCKPFFQVYCVPAGKTSPEERVIWLHDYTMRTTMSWTDDYSECGETEDMTDTRHEEGHFIHGDSIEKTDGCRWSQSSLFRGIAQWETLHAPDTAPRRTEYGHIRALSSSWLFITRADDRWLYRYNSCDVSTFPELRRHIAMILRLFRIWSLAGC